MSYKIIVDDEDPDGREFVYPSEDAYNAAEQWYAANSKTRLIAYALDHKLAIWRDAEQRQLRSDWADIVMEHYANRESKP